MWEYKIIKDWEDGNPDSEYELNELGKEGWELVALRWEGAKGYVWYFKRLSHVCKKCGGKGWVGIPNDRPSTCLICCGTGLRNSGSPSKNVS